MCHFSPFSEPYLNYLLLQMDGSQVCRMLRAEVFSAGIGVTWASVCNLYNFQFPGIFSKQLKICVSAVFNILQNKTTRREEVVKYWLSPMILYI